MRSTSPTAPRNNSGWKSATAEFQKTSAGRSIKVNLHGMGSMEGARAVLDGPKPIPFQVWSPASSAYRDAFEQEWRTKHANKPILKSDNLALTPMVFVMWEDRREAFIKKYSKPSFQTVSQAMGEQGGWGTIAQQAQWGRFNFGHTHPKRSNSGLLTLVLMAYEYSKKERNLTHADVADAGFQKWLRSFFTALLGPAGRSHRVLVP